MKRDVSLLGLSALLFFGAVGACNKEVPPTPAALPTTTGSAPVLSDVPPGASEPTSMTGKVLETMDSGGYTYVKLATEQGEKWCAVPAMPVTVGETFTVSGAMEVNGFVSKTLNRTFDQIYFGTAGGGSYQQIAGMHAGRTAEKATLDAPVKKADGPDGRTIGELAANAVSLKGKRVAVRGKVVKYTANVLGRNWVHLQDGTGTTAFDIAVTTAGTAAIGDVVTACGVVHVDRDFGGGYTYPVILEDAVLEK